MWGRKRDLFISLTGITLLGSLPLGMSGMPLSFRERILLFTVNALTCAVSWWSFQRIFRDRAAGMICAMLYTLSIPRLYLLYGKNEVREALSMLFLPLAVCALHGIYTEKNRKKRLLFWGILFFAVTAALQTYMLAGVLAGLAVCTVFLLLRRTSFSREVLPELLFSVTAAILCNIRQIQKGIEAVKINVGLFEDMPDRMIQSRGLYPAQLFLSFFEKGEGHNYVEKGLTEVEAIGIGMALMLPLCIFVFLRLAGAAGSGRESLSIRIGNIAAVVGSGALILSLSVFPWTEIQSVHRYAGAAIAMLQSPEHFLIIATAALATVAGAVWMWINAMDNAKIRNAYAILAVLSAAGTAVYYLGSVCSGMEIFGGYPV